MLRVVDCVADRVRLAIPQATEWKRIGNQIDAAFMLAQANFVNVNRSNGFAEGAFCADASTRSTSKTSASLNETRLYREIIAERLSS